jgi:hypothetical protein
MEALGIEALAFLNLLNLKTSGGWQVVTRSACRHPDMPRIASR